MICKIKLTRALNALRFGHDRLAFEILRSDFERDTNDLTLERIMRLIDTGMTKEAEDALQRELNC